jgi:hypothetical protein
MVFTRRLYELDEVVAAFMTSMKKQHSKESLFWLEELELSCEDELAKDSMFDIWFIQKGLAWWAWLDAWTTYKDTYEGRVALVKIWCSGGKTADSTLWRSYCLALATNKPWDTANHRKPALEWWSKGECKDRGKDTKYSRFAKVLQGNKRKECTLLWLNFVNPKITPIDIVLDDINIEEAELSSSKNIRAARLFAIPYDCHIGFTRRGLSENTGDTLKDMSLYNLLSSPIWAGLLDPYINGENEWQSDEMKEQFYDKYFKTCDLPDEWSATDREKSHGRAPSSRCKIDLLKWWSLWVPDTHKYIYGVANSWLMEWVRSKNIKMNCIHELEEMYSEYVSKQYTIGKKLIIYQ